VLDTDLLSEADGVDDSDGAGENGEPSAASDENPDQSERTDQSESQSESTEQSESQTQSESQSESESQTQSESQSESESQNQSESTEQTEPQTKASVTITVIGVESANASSGKAISNARFVLKNASTGSVITTSKGKVKYLLTYAGTALAITGLESGQSYILSQISGQDGYQISEDITFTAGTDQELTVKNVKIPSDGRSITVTPQAFYNGVLLTAAKALTSGTYVAVFTSKNGKPNRRVSAVTELSYTKDAQDGEPVTLTLSESETSTQTTYLVALTDAYGVPVGDSSTCQGTAAVTVTKNSKTNLSVTLQATYQTGSYPEDDFYYDAPVKVKKNTEKCRPDGNCHKVLCDSFYRQHLKKQG
jgi:DNA mismatch repair ATPase MutL